MVHLLASILMLLQAPAAVQQHLGTYRGTLRNAAGVAQLGTSELVTTTVTLEQGQDSLRLLAVSRTGDQRLLGAWPSKRVTTSGSAITATGVPHGPLHHRRDLRWTMSGGIRVRAELTMRGKTTSDDDYFGGKVVVLTLLKVR